MPSMAPGSIEQVAKTAQGFRQANKARMENIKVRLDAVRSDMKEPMIDEDMDYQSKSIQERDAIEDTAPVSKTALITGGFREHFVKIFPQSFSFTHGRSIVQPWLRCK